MSLTIWKVRSLHSSEATHRALHQTFLPDKHRHQVLAVPTRVPRQAHTRCRTITQISTTKHASQWREDWNAGDANTSGSSDGELYGLQIGRGNGKGGSLNGICHNCGKSGHSASSVMQKVEKAKGRGKKGDSKGWNDSKGLTVGKEVRQ